MPLFLAYFHNIYGIYFFLGLVIQRTNIVVTLLAYLKEYITLEY